MKMAQKIDPFDRMSHRTDMPDKPLELARVREHMTKLVDEIDLDALAWCEFICTRDARCKKGNTSIYPPDDPLGVLTSFLTWITASSTVDATYWGHPDKVSAPIDPSASLLIKWAYGDKAEFKVRSFDGQRMVIIKKVWTSDIIAMVPEVEVLFSYVRTEVAQATEYAKTLVIPSRADETTTGQMKIATDVALMLPYVKRVDDVLVIGSANCSGIGESYHLLAGAVDRVVCVDPQEIEATYDMAGTTFIRQAKRWVVGEPLVADVVFADAWIEGVGTIRGPVDAREYSLKVTRDEPDLYYKWEVSGECHEYRQLSVTQETRLVSNRRDYSAPRGRMGTCAACRELDSVWPPWYEFSPSQRKVWRAVHRYGGGTCAYMQTTYVQMEAPQVCKTYPYQIKKFLTGIHQILEKVPFGSIMHKTLLLEEEGSQSELLFIIAEEGGYVLAISGPKLPRPYLEILNIRPQLSPKLWSLWRKGRCQQVGTGIASLRAVLEDLLAQRPFR